MAFNHDCQGFEKTAKLPQTDLIFLYPFPDDCRRVKCVDTSVLYKVHDLQRKIFFQHDPGEPELSYYIQPPDLTYNLNYNLDTVFTNGDANAKALCFEGHEDKVLVPDEWRWQVLAQPAIALCDTENYGDKTPQVALASYFREWWDAMDAWPQDREESGMCVGAW
jgi:hypothetical protein